MSLGACRHFTGIQHPACAAGVDYMTVRVVVTREEAVARGTSLGAAWPCLAGSHVDNCPRREYPSRDEIAAEVRETSELARNASRVRAAIVAKEGKRRAVQGEIPCPVCATGTVRYTIAGTNGHVWARCSTPDCVRFME